MNVFKHLQLILITVILLSGILIKYQQPIFYQYNKVFNPVYASEIDRFGYDTYNSQKQWEVINKEIESRKVDQERVKKVRKYLESRNAPLAKEAEYFVSTADYFNIDYRLVAAISVIESGGGKNNYRPYNSWGWGGQGRAFVFKNYKEGIYTVSRGLSRYYKSGLKTPTEISKRYNPESWQEWSRKVDFVMSQM